MKEFKLNAQSDNIFLVNLSEIEKRLDAYYYKPSFEEINYKIKNRNFTSIKKESIKIFSGITPKSKGAAYTSKETGIAFVRSGDFSEDNYIDFNSCNYILEDIHHNTMKGSQLLNGDILIAIVGATIGKVGVYNYSKKANINQAICAVRLNPSFNPFFVQIFLMTSFGQLIIDRLKRPVARANINLEEISTIPLPNLKIDKQNKIVQFYNNALVTKQQKQKESKDLLASIDDYLLDELGIELPQKDNSLENRIFTTSLSEISSGRFDPFYLTNCIVLPISSKYKETELHHIAKVEKGQSITSSDVVEGEYPVIAGGQSSPYSHNKYNQDGNIITISASGAYSGYVWYHDEKIFASDCSVVQSKNEVVVSTKFIFNVLKLKQQQIYNLQQGSGQPHVYPSDIKRIKVPLPKLNKQEEINTNIANIRNQAKQLELEADQIIIEAKAEVENMILG